MVGETVDLLPLLTADAQQQVDERIVPGRRGRRGWRDAGEHRSQILYRWLQSFQPFSLASPRAPRPLTWTT